MGDSIEYCEQCGNRVGCHLARQCYATHVLEAGASIRDVQEQLGHAHLDTTMIYAHGDGERVRSPLEVL